MCNRSTDACVDPFTCERFAEKMVYSTYKLQRILYYYFQGYKVPTISKLLREEKLKASRVGIAKILKRYEETGSIGRRPDQGA